MTAAWYTAGKSRLIYTLDAASMGKTSDPTAYPLTAFIGFPLLKIDPLTVKYSLVDGQAYLDVLDDNLNAPS